MRRLLLLIIVATTGLLLFGAGMSWARPGPPKLAISKVEIKTGHSRLVDLPAAAKRVSVGEPKVADVVVISPRQIYINAKAVGSTNVSVWDQQGRVMGIITVWVNRDLTRLKERLHQVLPNEPIEVRELEGVVVLSGRVSSARVKKQAEDLAAVFAPKKMTSLLEIGAPQQVILEVKFAEVNRKVTKRLNINLAAFNLGGLFIATFLGGLTNNQAQPIPTLGSYTSNSVSGNPWEQGWVLSSKVNSLASFNVPGGGQVTGFLDALKQNGLVRMLAEPTLVAASGEEAQFLAGGEYPVPVAQDNSVTILFKKFGVQLKFKPEVKANGRIRLLVHPTVSELDFTVATVVSGYTVPGLTTREAKTHLELRDGQSFVIAGLFRNDMAQTVGKVPWLGDIPILGALFRSTEFQSNQTELVIVVTPKLVRPGMGKPGRLPTDGWVEPSETELFLLGRMAKRKPPAKGLVPSFRELEGEFGHDWIY